MRIVAGEWRGRALVAPPGQGTRPTADRVRQALFDMLMHAEWGGRDAIEGALVLDVFAGTGALGLEALSRGAASACFIENDPVALKALRANVAACKAEDRAVVLSSDALTVGSIMDALDGPAGAAIVRPHAQALRSSSPNLIRRSVQPSELEGAGPGMVTTRLGITTSGLRITRESKGITKPASLVFLDPPYSQNLVPRAIAWLKGAGRIALNALVIAETGREETWLPDQPVLAERQHGAARILFFRTD